MKSIRSAALIASAIVIGASPTTRAQQPQLQDVLAKAEAYVQTFVTRFSNVVAEERYTQERTSPGRRTRTMVSDYFLISLPGSSDWLELRDVIEVDGKPVGNREDRLLTLVKDGSPQNWAARARAVARESARFNLEDIGTINRPLVAMALLQAPYRGHFEFSLGSIEKKVAADARLIRFREARPPTMFNVGPLYGNIWVSEATGVVLKTELQFGNNREMINHVVTTFAPDADMQVNIPVEMDEAYAYNRGGGTIEVTGHATYGRFRKFGVKTEEVIR